MRIVRRGLPKDAAGSIELEGFQRVGKGTGDTFLAHERSSGTCRSNRGSMGVLFDDDDRE